MPSLRTKLTERLFQPTDSASLVFFRIAFGLIMLWEIYRYFDHGWIDRYWVEPDFHFSYFGFDWIKPWPGKGMHLHFIALGVLAFSIAIGFLYRTAMALFFIGFTYVFLLDQTTYLNHFYLISLISFAMIFVPANCAFSVDARLNIARWKGSFVPFWTVAVIAFVIALPYFFGGIAKLNSDWLQGEPMRYWLRNQQDFPVIGRLFTKEWMVYAFSYGGILFDLLIVPLLLWKPTRRIAVVAMTAFHIVNAQLFKIGIFPWFMIAATPIFCSPSWPRKFLRLLAPKRVTLPAAEIEAFPGNRAVIAGLALFIAFQIAMPLRHWLYPGNVNWTEEGHRFAWHMKLRDKFSTAEFYVFDPASASRWTVDTSSLLSRRQAWKMSSRPDMILQFAHSIARGYRESGIENVEVHAKILASLNGRPHQLLVAPDVDLAKEKRSLAHADWILPLTTPLVPKPVENQ